MTDTIGTIIHKFPFGVVFTPSGFPIGISKQASVNRILNNMVAAEEIRRLSKGRFYKPQIGKFGELPPDTYQVVKNLIEEENKIVNQDKGSSYD